MLGDPLYQLPTLGPVAPEQPQLCTGPAEPGQEQARPCRVGDRGGRHDHGQQAPQRSDEPRSLAAFALLPTLVAALSPQCGGRDALAVPRPRGGMRVTAFLVADLGAQGIMEPLPVPAGTPWAEVPRDTQPLGVRVGQHAPWDASVDHIKNRMDHRAPIQCTRVSPRFGGGSNLCYNPMRHP